jgi:hypothetical protein
MRSASFATGAGPCIRETDIENILLYSWNFGGNSSGTRKGDLRFLANSFSSMLIQIDLRTVWNPREILVRIHGSTLHDRYVTAL